jgi:hypothetical protein
MRLGRNLLASELAQPSPITFDLPRHALPGHELDRLAQIPVLGFLLGSPWYQGPGGLWVRLIDCINEFA